MKKIIFILIIRFCLLNAYTFSPPTVSLSASGINSSFIYTIKNEDDRIVPIDLSINKFSKDIDGNHIQGEIVYDDFIIYPAQFILDVGEKRSVQVRWTGEPKVDIEQNFTILCKEVFLPKKETKSSKVSAIVKVKMNYEGRLYIEPENGYSGIVLDAINSPVNENGEQMLEIVVRNIGNIHGNLSSFNFIVNLFEGNADEIAQSLTLTSKEIPKMLSSIHAGSKRRYRIPWPEEIPFGNINVELRKK
ncbi:MAG: hypothetical protein GQ534_09705 [Candidatus Delongbacteria bacterium]|nr:hypothetical protein [Candidatus Delongbacteria bacterium]